jgi:hypothetical protein
MHEEGVAGDRGRDGGSKWGPAERGCGRGAAAGGDGHGAATDGDDRGGAAWGDGHRGMTGGDDRRGAAGGDDCGGNHNCGGHCAVDFAGACPCLQFLSSGSGDPRW